MTQAQRRDCLKQLEEVDRHLTYLCLKNNIIPDNGDHYDKKLNQALLTTRQMLQRATASLSK